MKIENDKKAITVVNSDVTGSSFKNVRAEEVTIQCANLTGIRLNDVNLTGMNISDANLSNLAIDGAQWGGAHFQHIGYSDKDQPESEQSGRAPVQFTNTNMKRGVFTDCDFTNAKLFNCDVTGLVINGQPLDQLLDRQDKQERSSESLVQPYSLGLFFYVRNIRQAISMYSQLFGYPVREDGLLFDHLYFLPNGIALDAHGMEDRPLPEWLPVSLKLATSDIDRTKEHVEQLGFAVTHEINHGPQVSWFLFKDPDGNTLMMCQDH